MSNYIKNTNVALERRLSPSSVSGEWMAFNKGIIRTLKGRLVTDYDDFPYHKAM